MSGRREVRVPDIGDVEGVTVIEILVRPGQRVAVDDGLVTLESDKASMDIPAPFAGLVEEIVVAVGETVSQGDLVLTLAQVESPGDAPQAAGAEELAADEQASPAPRPAGDREEAPAAVGSGSAGGRRERDGAGVRSAEVLVLGGGPGGYTAAFRAADLGKKVVLVERHGALGGVCLNVGCIPSKALLHVARVLDEAAELADRGVAFGEPAIDLDELRRFKQSVVDRLTKGLSALAGRRQVEVVRGTGALAGPRELVVEGPAGTERIAFEQAILAAGSRAVRIPGIPWEDPRVWDSTAALELPEVPRRLLVVGGGIIGLEMATVYGALGSELTIVELLEGLIPGCDRDLVKPLERRLKRRYGARVHLRTKVAAVAPVDEGLEVSFEGERAPDVASFDRVLVAVGRRPNSDRIGAEAAGVELDERGFVKVDGQQRTSVPSIFAIGDLVGQPMLAHKASHQGKVAAEAAAGLPSAFDARVIPSVAYTDPEIAWVGLSETAAAAAGIQIETASFPWSASGRALGIGRSDGSTKLVFDPGTRRILGAGIVGPNAGDLIAEAALAIEMDCEAADLALTVHPHPTLSETLAFAAEAFEGTLTDLYLPKR